MESKVTIGITDCSKYDNYRKWMESEGGVEVIRLSYESNNFDEIRKCNGVVLTGGGDVHPRFYNKSEYMDLCSDIDEKRDEFEWKVLGLTEQHQVPVLGICRGLQVANVYFGGTLIPHIPAFGKFDHSRIRETDKYHEVTVDPNSRLHDIVKSTTGEVNSAHHQSADLVGKGLVCNALSSDGVVEGLERSAKDGHAFLMLVQWHPERMKDQASSFSANLKREFLAAVKISK
jgi:putative glutamine amidotransferase